MAPLQLSEQQITTIAETLKAAREKKGENLADAAFRIALSPSQLRAIESGDLRPFYSPGYFLQAAQRYADFLGATLDIAPPPPPPPEPIATTAAEPTAIARDTATSDGHRSNTAPDASTFSVAADASGPSGMSLTNALAPPAVEVSAERDAHPPSQAVVETISASTEKTAGVPWGWIAFGAAALIAIGIIKISFDKPTPARESIVKQEPTKAETDTSAPTPAPAPASAAAPAPPTKAPSPAVNPTTSSAPAPAASAAAPTLMPPVKASPVIAANDSQLESQASTWVQIVKSNGEKVNTKIEPGQKLDFASSSTAAIVFGQPDKAALKIQGKPVNIAPFVTSDTPPRALVILNQIKN